MEKLNSFLLVSVYREKLQKTNSCIIAQRTLVHYVNTKCLLQNPRCASGKEHLNFRDVKMWDKQLTVTVRYCILKYAS